MSEQKIEVERREATGKNASRRLRAAGQIPAIVYGGGMDSVSIQVDRKTIKNLLRQEGGEHAVFQLKLAGTGSTRHALIRDIAVDPVSREIDHIDFQRVLMTEKVRVSVGVELQGVPEGVKNQGGVLDFVTREVEVECLPGDIPTKLTLDVSALEVGHHFEVKDLKIPAGVTVVEEPDRVLVSVAHARVAAAEPEAGEGLLEAEEAQPEVIGKGKAEEQEGD